MGPTYLSYIQPYCCDLLSIAPSPRRRQSLDVQTYHIVPRELGAFHAIRDNYNLKSHKYVYIATYKPDTKSNPNLNPNLNPTTNSAIVSIQL